MLISDSLTAGGRRGGGDKGGKEDFEDMRLTLQETDYGAFLANEVSPSPLFRSKPRRGF